MKKIVLKEGSKTVSAELPLETSLDEALIMVDGLLKALGFCFDGKLTIGDKDEKN